MADFCSGLIAGFDADLDNHFGGFDDPCTTRATMSSVVVLAPTPIATAAAATPVVRRGSFEG